MLVDTSIWSLALRRDADQAAPEVEALRHALLGTDQVFTTRLVFQELLQGFAGPKARAQLVERLSALACLQPDREDHIDAADVRNVCRRRGVQVGTIDAVLMQRCRRHDPVLLTTDPDFYAAAKHVEFRLWRAPRGLARTSRRHQAERMPELVELETRRMRFVACDERPSCLDVITQEQWQSRGAHRAWPAMPVASVRASRGRRSVALRAMKADPLLEPTRRGGHAAVDPMQRRS